jgi:hypothetical protein
MLSVARSAQVAGNRHSRIADGDARHFRASPSFASAAIMQLWCQHYRLVLCGPIRNATIDREKISGVV